MICILRCIKCYHFFLFPSLLFFRNMHRYSWSLCPFSNWTPRNSFQCLILFICISCSRDWRSCVLNFPENIPPLFSRHGKGSSGCLKQIWDNRAYAFGGFFEPITYFQLLCHSRNVQNCQWKVIFKEGLVPTIPEPFWDFLGLIIASHRHAFCRHLSFLM